MIFFRIFEYYFMNVREDTQCDGTILSDIIKINDPELLCTLFLENIEEELSPLFKYKNNFKYLNCKWNKSTVTIEMENDESFPKITMDDFKNKSSFMQDFSLICKKVKKSVKKGSECIINFDVDFDQNSKFYDNFNQVIIEVIKESHPKFITLKIKEDDLFEYQDNPFENYVQYFYKKGDDFYIAFCRISGGTNLEEITEELQSLYIGLKLFFLKENNIDVTTYRTKNSFKERIKYLYDFLLAVSKGKNESIERIFENFFNLKNLPHEVFPYVDLDYFKRCLDFLKDVEKYSFFLTSYKNSLDTEEKKKNFEIIQQNVCFCPEDSACNCNEIKNLKSSMNVKKDNDDQFLLEELKYFFFYVSENHFKDFDEMDKEDFDDFLKDELEKIYKRKLIDFLFMFKRIFYVYNVKQAENLLYLPKDCIQIPEKGLTAKQKNSIRDFFLKKEPY